MKILLVSQERPLDEEEVVSGNAVRTRQLTDAITGAGHEIMNAWLCRGKGSRNRNCEFRNGDQLQSVINRTEPDVILVTYWELVSLLPYEPGIPVALDFVAPRPLEELFESTTTVRQSLRLLRNALGRCDLVMVGNELQRHLLIYNLIEAGIDLRDQLPVISVPLGSHPIEREYPDPALNGWTLVTGGVDWPWRRSSRWNEKLSAAIGPSNSRLVIFGGSYRWHQSDTGQTEATGRNSEGEHGVDHRQLETYSNFSRFLATEAHIGVELADQNIERTYSQSFRSLEFLRHGLPLICNSYLPIAGLIGKNDAGWLVDDPDQIDALIEHIRSHPEEWRQKSDNARNLVVSDLSPASTAKQLLDWLENPKRADRLSFTETTDNHPPVLGVPPLRTRIARQWRLVRKFFLPRILGLGRSKEKQSGKGVIIVTRGDLFPADHGAAVRTIETARALAGAGLRVGLVTDNKKHWYRFKGNEITTRRFPWWSRFLSLPGPVTRLLHHSKEIPHSDSFLYLPLSDGSWFWRILLANKEIRADILQAEFPAYAAPCLEAAQALGCGVVLVEHNIEYQRMRSQVAELSDLQFENLRAIELDLCRRVDAVVCVSDNDRRQLEKDGVNPDRLHTIPHGVDLAMGEQSPEPSVRKQFDIDQDSPLLVFHGTYSYPPNREVLGVFANIIIPGLEEMGINVHLLAIGKDAPSTPPHDRIHFPGSVPSVGPWLRAADIAVVPLTDGGGTRMKILDYFAAGLPVVSTSKGIEGIPVRNGHEAVIVDDWPVLIQSVAQLITDGKTAEGLARNGRSFAEGLSWDAIGQRYLKVFTSIGR